MRLPTYRSCGTASRSSGTCRGGPAYCHNLPARAIISSMFAEVAVPVNVRQTFTYRLRGDLGSRAAVGSRVLVPFGKKFLTAFIVDLHPELQGDVDETNIKDIEELLDESPVINNEVL